jgi:CO/xanthine dehydrogenase Mo-binding subunit
VPAIAEAVLAATGKRLRRDAGRYRPAEPGVIAFFMEGFRDDL